MPSIPAKLRSGLAALVFATIAVRQLHSASLSHSAFITFVGLRMIVVAALFLFREPARKDPDHFQSAIAIASTFLPFMLYATGKPQLFNPGEWMRPLWGLLIGANGLSFWATICLGRSFGISPAVRTRVSRGPYRFLHHPIYVSYVLAEGAFTLMVPTWRNLAVWTGSTLLYVWRARLEDRLLIDAEPAA